MNTNLALMSSMAPCFEFIRNEDLNGRNYFAAAGSKPEFRRNQYGFVLGGPVQKNRRSSLQIGKVRDYSLESRVSAPYRHWRNDPVSFQRAIYDSSTAARLPFPDNLIPSDPNRSYSSRKFSRAIPTEPGRNGEQLYSHWCGTGQSGSIRW